MDHDTTMIQPSVSSDASTYLDQSSNHQTMAPLRNLEHYEPALSSVSLLGVDGELDLGKLALNPLLVASIVVQLSQSLHAFFESVGRDYVSG